MNLFKRSLKLIEYTEFYMYFSTDLNETMAYRSI